MSPFSLFAALLWTSILITTSASPLSDVNGCYTAWDFWGVACAKFQTCDNAPNVILGDMYKPPSRLKTRSLEPRARRDDPVQWCQVGTRTWVSITASANSLAQPGNINAMLRGAVENLQRTIKRKGDGEIGDGGFRWLGKEALVLTAKDANDHHITYGVLAAALQAVDNWMSSPGQYYRAVFLKIYDGENQVGWGEIHQIHKS